MLSSVGGVFGVPCRGRAASGLRFRRPLLLPPGWRLGRRWRSGRPQAVTTNSPIYLSGLQKQVLKMDG